MLTFSTPRLRVRPITLADAPRLAEYRSDPAVARWVPWDPPYPIEKATELLTRLTAREGIVWGEWRMMAVVLADTRQHIGDCVAKLSAEDQNQAEIGYILDGAHHGRGLATELVRECVTRLFGDVGLHRVYAVVSAPNAASWRLLEKLRFRREATHVDARFFKGEWTTDYIYATLRTEWGG